MKQIVTIFEIECRVDSTGTLTLDLSGEERLADGELELRYPPNGAVDEYARFEVRDPRGCPLDVKWEGAGLMGEWAKSEAVSTSPMTDKEVEVWITAAPKDPQSKSGGASTVRIRIKKPGKGDPPV